MPQVVTTSGLPVNQSGTTSRPSTTQLDFRQMSGEVSQWNPDAPPTMVARWIQNSYRKILDERSWYGTLVKGVLSVPDVYSVGSISATNGSKTITGTGTVWDATFIGRQIRIGFSFPVYTIASVESATSLTLDLPWSEPNQTVVGYQIYQSIVTFGRNMKQLHAVLNQRQGWRLWVNMPQEAINSVDAWRASVGFTLAALSHTPSAAGEPQWELYPAPTSQQSFPFVGFVQPPDLSDDNPFPLLNIRSDVIVMGGIKDALLFRGKNSKYYDPQTAQLKAAEQKVEIEKMKLVDDNLWMQDLQWDFSQYPYANMGATWHQSHDMDYM